MNDEGGVFMLAAGEREGALVLLLLLFPIEEKLLLVGKEAVGLLLVFGLLK